MKEADKANEGASHHEAGWHEALEMRLSRRSLLAGAAATAAISVIGLPRKSAAAETPLQILTGPVTPMGSTAYDTMQLAQAAAWVNVNPDLTLTEAYFYDGALAYYLLYYRTGDTQWLTRAHLQARTQADYVVSHLDSGGRSAMAPRDYSTIGMAIHYLLTGYANSLTGVRVQAAAAPWYFSPYGPPGSSATQDARESAYALMAMLVTSLLGGDPNNYSSAMSTALNAYLTYQGFDGTAGRVQPNVAWQGTSSLVPGDGIYILNYMSGLVMETLIMYDRIIGDSRIAPAIKSCVDWMWSTQWVPLGGGPDSGTGNGYPTDQTGPGIGCFQYANITAGSVNINSNANYACLMGLILPAFGYLYQKGQGGVYKTNGDAVLAAMAQSKFFGSKQFNQAYRSSPRYLGWTRAATGNPAAPSNLIVQ